MKPIIEYPDLEKKMHGKNFIILIRSVMVLSTYTMFSFSSKVCFKSFIKKTRAENAYLSLVIFQQYLDYQPTNKKMLSAKFIDY